LAALVRDDYRAQDLRLITTSICPRRIGLAISATIWKCGTLVSPVSVMRPSGAVRSNCLDVPRAALPAHWRRGGLDATDLSLQSIARADHARVAMRGAVLPSGPAVRRESTRPAAVDPPTCSRPYASCGARRRRGERTASGADRQRTARMSSNRQP